MLIMSSIPTYKVQVRMYYVLYSMEMFTTQKDDRMSLHEGT